MDLGVRLAVLAGPVVPAPLPPPLAERVVEVSAHESDGARSGFRITLDAGRSGPAELADSIVQASPQLRGGARVSIVLIVGIEPIILADGFITKKEQKSGGGTGHTQVVLTGEDVAWLLDREQVTRALPMDDYSRVAALLAPYAAHGIVPQAIPPADLEVPFLLEWIPAQNVTDYQYLTALAQHHGYVTYAVPGPAPGTSTWYWGPQVRVGLPQRAITVGQVPSTNVIGDVSFSADANKAIRIDGQSTDRATGRVFPVKTLPPTRIPLAAEPLWADAARVQQTVTAGTSMTGTIARAQAEVDASADTVTATGKLDGARYGSALRPRGLVGLRGAGWRYDGNWYVRSVEHTWRPGSWTQDFTVVRDGFGSLVPVVRP